MLHLRNDYQIRDTENTFSEDAVITYGVILLFFSFFFRVSSPHQILTDTQKKRLRSVPRTVFPIGSTLFIYTFGTLKGHEQLLARDYILLKNI